MVVGDSGAALLPSLRSVVMVVMVFVLVEMLVVMLVVVVVMMMMMMVKMMMVKHCVVEGKERVRCIKIREENKSKMRK